MSRCLLAQSRLKEFRDWLINDGWDVVAPTNVYEVLRAQKPASRGGKRKTIVIYHQNGKTMHYTVPAPSEGVVRAFIQETRELRAEDIGGEGTMAI